MAIDKKVLVSSTAALAAGILVMLGVSQCRDGDNGDRCLQDRAKMERTLDSLRNVNEKLKHEREIDALNDSICKLKQRLDDCNRKKPCDKKAPAPKALAPKKPAPKAPVPKTPAPKAPAPKTPAPKAPVSAETSDTHDNSNVNVNINGGNGGANNNTVIINNGTIINSAPVPEKKEVKEDTVRRYRCSGSASFVITVGAKKCR